MSDPDCFQLEGAPNYRDFGGYRTHFGCRVVTGKLFRSGVLDLLTIGDQSHLFATGLTTVIDLRGERESRVRPHEFGEQLKPTVLAFPISGDVRTNDVSMMDLISQNPTPEGVHDAMMFAYRELPKRFAPHLPELFKILCDEDSYPILIHCTAGKDRTGLLCALIQSAIGVSIDDIVHDYMLTNEYCPPETYSPEMLKNTKERFGFELSDEASLGIKCVKEVYLERAFETINNKYGGVVRYLEQCADLSDEKQARLQEILLEEA